MQYLKIRDVSAQAQVGGPVSFVRHDSYPHAILVVHLPGIQWEAIRGVALEAGVALTVCNLS